MRAALVLTLALPILAETPATIGAPSMLASHMALRGGAPELLAERGRLELLCGDRAKGEDALKTALEIGATRGEVYRLVALAWLTDGQPEKAFAVHERMLQATPKADDPIAHAAVDLVQAGFPEKADAMMEVAFKLDPRDWDELMYFAVAAADARQTALSVKWFGRIRGMDDGDAKQDAWPQAERLLGAGRVEEAAALVDQILKARPRDWEFALAVARAAALAGNKPLTKAWCARALASSGSQPELLVELALLSQGKVMPYRR